MANISRCVLSSSDKTNLSRFFSEADWSPEAVNEERVKYMLEKTEKHRLGSKKSVLSLDDTLLEHVGSLFEYIAKHYNHSNGTYPMAYNLVTSHYVSGAVLFDGWNLAPELIEALEEHHKSWISILKPNRNISTNNLRIFDEEGKKIIFEDSKIKAEDLIKLIPPSSFEPTVLGAGKNGGKVGERA